jgi:serine/threonine protein kinase/tetratricopeptide (TPR) repeat protein
MTPDRRQLLGRYTLVEKLGAGGHGEVWRAQDATLGIEVALKVLSPALARSASAWEALEHEHEIAGRLDHPSILKVYSPQRDADAAALPMELAAGGDLRRLRGGSYLQIMPAVLEIAAALEYAHGEGVIHRDLKPGNVLFDAHGRAVLADFGVAGTAFAVGRDKVRSGLSPFTASPEQLRGEPPAVSDDIYGLGALAYELLAGQPPFYPHFDVQRVLDEPAPELRPVQPTPPQLVAIVMRMLEKQPQARPLSMRAVIEEFDATLNDTLHFEFDAEPEPQAMRRESPKRPPLPTRPAPSIPTKPPGPPPRAKPSPTASEPHTALPRPPKAQPRAMVREPVDALPEAEATLLTEEPATPAPKVAPRIGPILRPELQPSPWGDLKIVPVARLSRLDPIPARRWPWVVLFILAANAAAAFYWMPRYGSDALVMIESAAPPGLLASLTRAAQPQAKTNDGESEAHLRDARAVFDQQMAALDSRGAGTWGGHDFSDAKLRSAEAQGAFEAGNPSFAAMRLAQAQELLNAVEKRAPVAQLAPQLAAGERALAAGRTQSAKQAFESAQRIDPTNRKAADGLQRIGSLEAARPLLADAASAEDAGDTARSMRDYHQALTLDPKNGEASAGLARAHAALGEDGYVKAVGSGVAALGAGRLDEARAAFEKARDFRPDGPEAAEGMTRLDAATRAHGFDATRQRASSLEAQERWDDALSEYETALQADPSLVFAQQGKARTSARALLAQRLQELIDRPERLASVAARADALTLIDTANEQAPSGPVLRSQVARLEILLPNFDKPVHLALVSDDATRVAIPSVGFSGVFSRREIQLKPGKYTVVGTRDGYRDVRRDITIAPGQDVQTISVSCGESI